MTNHGTISDGWVRIISRADQVLNSGRKKKANLKKRAVHQFPARTTPNGALVLKFESPELHARWQEFRDAGASWDFSEYAPHITITYSVPKADVGKIRPYRGPLIFGPEEFAEVDEGWANEIKEESL